VIDDLEAAIELVSMVGPGFEIYLAGPDGPIGHWCSGDPREFMASGAGTFTTVAFEWNKQKIAELPLTPLHMSTGDTAKVDNGDVLAKAIYQLIEAGMFSADVG
jgi:hypothetical protein